MTRGDNYQVKTVIITQVVILKPSYKKTYNTQELAYKTQRVQDSMRERKGNRCGFKVVEATRKAIAMSKS